jgi:hypothetical protein
VETLHRAVKNFEKGKRARRESLAAPFGGQFLSVSVTLPQVSMDLP